MKAVGLVAIVVGLIVMLLGLLTSPAGPENLRALTAAGVIAVAAGLILYRRGRRRALS
jgi:hypothetical protein